MDFLQNLKAQHLIERFNYYANPANITEFETSLMLYPFIVSKWEAGYLRFSDNTLVYKDLSTGNSSIVRTVRNNNKDYNCFQMLRSVGIQTGNFRFVNITHREIISNDQLEYIETSMPNNEIGMTITSEFINHKPSLSVFLEYINQVTPVLAEAETIAINNNVNFPNPLEICSLLARSRDSIGYFWAPAINWNSSKSKTIEHILNFLEGVLSNRIVVGDFTTSEVEELLNHARTSWQ